MKRIKIITVVGTRPEIIRLSSIIKKLNISPFVEHILVHTGQNYDYELNDIFFKDFNIEKPKYYLNSAKPGSSMGTIGNILIDVDLVFEKENPDALLILGDTNSCLCVIAAKKRKIPIFHMEAGNRCFDQRVPEEINRKIIDHTSDINMTYSDISREHLIREGLPSDCIIKTGSPMYEVIHDNMEGIIASKILDTMELSKGKYFVVSAHREENISPDRSFKSLIESLNILADLYKIPIIFSTHPRTRIRINTINIKLNPLICLIKPLGFFDYICLQINSKVVLSDSGTISEESSILDFCALNIRESHERPEAIEEMSVPMVGLKASRIIQGIEFIKGKKSLPVKDYYFPDVSDKVLGIVISYIDYVNNTVWKK